MRARAKYELALMTEYIKYEDDYKSIWKTCS